MQVIWKFEKEEINLTLVKPAVMILHYLGFEKHLLTIAKFPSPMTSPTKYLAVTAAGAKGVDDEGALEEE